MWLSYENYLILVSDIHLRLVHSLAVDIEDLENWHGKPIPKDKVDGLLKELKAQIQVPNKTLCPELPKEDTEPADLSPITMLAPPAYKKGEKVPKHWSIVFLFFMLASVSRLYCF